MKALIFVKEWNGRQVGEIHDIVSEVPKIFLMSDKICVAIDAPVDFNRAYHEAVLVAAQAEKWTKDGQPDSPTEPPYVDDGQGVMIPDASWTYVAAIPEHWEIQENAQKKAEYEQAQSVKNVSDAVSNAMSFSQSLMNEFITENIMLGIAQAGKTKVVRQAFGEVVNALMTGSLYDAMDEARNIPVGQKDAVFVTDARLLAFVNKIEAYLGLPLSTAL